MKSMFDPNSPLMQLLTKIADLIILNILWILCCLPMFTVGASTTAMYRVTLKMACDEEGPVLKEFFHGFRENFSQGTLTFLILLVPILVLAADAWLITAGVFGNAAAMALASLPAGIVVGFVWSYVYPLMARFHNTLWGTLKNALILSFANLPKSLLITALNLAPLIWFLGNPVSFLKRSFLLLLIAFSGIAWINSKFLLEIFRRTLEQAEA